MRYLLALLSIVFFSFQPPAEHDVLIGKWEGEDKNETGTIVLNKDGSAEIYTPDGVIGGKDFEMEGIPMTLRYEVSGEKSPYQIDFIIEASIELGAEIPRLEGLIEVINENEIKMWLSFDGLPRPDNFEPGMEDDTVLLKRVK